MDNYTYRTKGTCSVQIQFALDEEKRVHDVIFTGGCNGNLKGIGKLVEGMEAQEVIDKLNGLRCGYKPTSCPDQLAHALSDALHQD